MTTYRSVDELAVNRAPTPESPFAWATLVRPYEDRHCHPITIDYIDLTAYARPPRETRVCSDVPARLAAERLLQWPLLVDATGAAEAEYGAGAESVEWLRREEIDSTLLISVEGALRAAMPRCSLAIATWPADEAAVETTFAAAAATGARWGAVIPIVLTVTTELSIVAVIVDSAARHGASFVAALPIELDPTAKREIASIAVLSDENTEESYAALFGDDLEPLIVSTERHVAALAFERGMLDHIPLPGSPRKDNWSAATYLSRIAQRMFRMERDVELAWSIHRSARIIAELGKPLDRIAESASFSIIEGIDDTSSTMLKEWSAGGSSHFGDELDRDWRLRRDLYR